MIVVLDTNVMVAALTASGLCHELLLRTIRLRALASSEPLLEELEATLGEKFTISPPVSAFLSALRASVRVVQPAALDGPICRDPDDDVVLATAVASGAKVIATGDHDLLVLKSYRGIAIVSPRALLERLEEMETR